MIQEKLIWHIRQTFCLIQEAIKILNLTRTKHQGNNRTKKIHCHYFDATVFAWCIICMSVVMNLFHRESHFLFFIFYSVVAYNVLLEKHFKNFQVSSFHINRFPGNLWMNSFKHLVYENVMTIFKHCCRGMSNVYLCNAMKYLWSQSQ